MVIHIPFGLGWDGLLDGVLCLGLEQLRINLMGVLRDG